MPVDIKDKIDTIAGDDERLVVSVITATYNSKDELVRTIDSIRKQTYTNIEWIVIDGGSHDGTVELLRSNESIINRWISEPDKGIGDAWNKGIELATGGAILILNAGDTYEPFAIETFANSFNENKISCANAALVSEDGDLRGVFKARPNKIWHGMHVPHNWCLVPRKFYEDMGLYKNQKYSMDFDWFYRYYKKYGDSGFVVIDKVLGNYALGGHSDKNFAKGFAANARIMVAGGSLPPIAWGFCGLYIVKHWLTRVLSKP